MGKPVNILEPDERNVDPSFFGWLHKTDTYSPAAADQNELDCGHGIPNLVDLLEFMTEFRTYSAAAVPTIDNPCKSQQIHY